jgi:putative flavoprotein involved in K+ transport
LVLFTPRTYSALPGLPVPGNPDGYPTKDEIANYLEQYAAHFDLPVALKTQVHSLARYDGGFRVTTDTGETFDTRVVVLASGAFQRPAVPAIAQQFAPEVLQLSPDSYKNPAQVPPGKVVIVGDGATGRQIAVELARTHPVVLATGRPRRASPERILGRSIFWWMDKLGVLTASRESRIGRYLMRTDPFPGKALDLKHLRRRGIQVVGRLLQVEGKQVSFAGGASAEVDAVIWATGYRDDSEWVAIPEVKDARGAFLHQRGVSPVPGLYFIGRSWQWTRGSALLHGVGDDAASLIGRIAAQLDSRPATLPRELRQASA